MVPGKHIVQPQRSALDEVIELLFHRIECHNSCRAKGEYS